MEPIQINVPGLPAALAKGPPWSFKPSVKFRVYPVWNVSSFVVPIVHLLVATHPVQSTVGLPAQWFNGKSRAWPKPGSLPDDRAQVG